MPQQCKPAARSRGRPAASTHRYAVRGSKSTGTVESPSSEQSADSMMPSSWQWQGTGQAARPGPSWGTPPAHGEAHSAAQSHSAGSRSGLGISVAGLRGTWQAHRRSDRRCSPPGPAAGPEGCTVGGDCPAGSPWRRQQRRQRRDRAVREGQALLSDLRYSVSQAGLGKGGRHRRRRSQGNFLRCWLPFPPSWQEFHPGKGGKEKKKKKKKRKGRKQRNSELGKFRPALVWKECPRAGVRWTPAPLAFWDSPGS